MSVDCFDKIMPHLSDKYKSRINDEMSDAEKKSEGIKLAMEEASKLNDGLNKLKRKIGISPNELSTETDYPKQVKEISDKHQKIIEEKKSEQGKTQMSMDDDLENMSEEDILRSYVRDALAKGDDINKIMEEAEQKLGDSFTYEDMDTIENAYNEFTGQEEKIPDMERDASKNVIGVKNSIVNGSRVHRDLEPYVKEAVRQLGSTWNKVKQRVVSGQDNPNNLVDRTYTQIKTKRRSDAYPAFNDEQNAQLLFHRLDTINRIKTAEELYDRIDAFGDKVSATAMISSFERTGDWFFKNDEDRNKFKELLKNAGSKIVKLALKDIIGDFHYDLEKNDVVAEGTGTAWGQAGRFRQVLINLRGEVVNWTQLFERKMGSHVDAESLKRMSGLEQENKSVVEELKHYTAEDLNHAAQSAYDRAVKEFKKTGVAKEQVDKEKKAKTLKSTGKQLANKILNFKIRIPDSSDGKTQMAKDDVDYSLGMRPEKYNEFIDKIAANINNNNGETLESSIEKELKKPEYSKLKKDDVVNHITGGLEVTDKREQVLNKLRKDSSFNNETTITKDNVRDIRNLMAYHIKSGTKTLEDLITKTRNDLREILPDASNDMIRDAFSGRGVRQDTRATVLSEFQRLKTQAANVGRYIELLQPKENETDSERMNRMKKLTSLYEGTDGHGIKDEIARLGVIPPNEQITLKDVQDKHLNNYREGIKKVIETNERALTNTKSEGEKVLLKEENSKLRSKLNAVTGTPEQRIIKMNSILNDQIAIYERERNKITNAFRSDRPEMGTEYYKAEQEGKDAFTKRIKEIRKAAKEIEIDNSVVSVKLDNEAVAAKLQDSLTKSIDKLQKDLDDENYEKSKPSDARGLEDMIAEPDPRITAKIRELEKQRNLLELKKRDEVEKYENSKKGLLAKAANALVRSKRIFVLVKVGILAKLAAAVMWGQTVFAPLNTLAGAIINKVGDVVSLGWVSGKSRYETEWGKLLDKSLRYGRVHGQAELQAYGKAWSWDNFKSGKGFIGFTGDTAKKMDGFKNESTFKSFFSDLNNNYNELSLLFGKDVAPNEYYNQVTDEDKFFQKEFWGTVGSGLDFGKGKDIAKGVGRGVAKTGEALVQVGEYGIRAHGAIKGVAKGMEFARSYFTIKENAKRILGESWVQDPVNQMSMGMIAYQEAVRGILMEDNAVSGIYQKMIQTLKKGGGMAQLGYLLTGEFMPVVKVPTNIALQAARATLGLPLSGTEIALRLVAEKLSGTKVAKITGTGEFLKRNGVEKMSNQHASALLRNLRNGTVGAFIIAGMIMGKMAASNYYINKKQSEEDDSLDKLEEGEVRIGDMTIARDLADNPYFVAMKAGETFIKAVKYYTEDDDSTESYLLSIAKALGVTAGGVIKESPIVSTPTELLTAIEGQRNMGWFWQNLVVSSTMPSEMREISMYMDKEDGNLIPYQGKTVKRLTPTIMDVYKAWTPWERKSLERK